MEKRKSSRISVSMNADIANGNQVFPDCDVINISQNGLLITNIRRNLTQLKSSNSCCIVIDIQGKPIKLNCRLKWFSKKDLSSYATAGFEIVDNLINWYSRIEHLLPKKDIDIWGIVEEKYVQ